MKYFQIIVLLMVMLVLSMLILPLPALWVDALISVNFMIALFLLFLALNMDDPLQFTSFPAVLLLMTLFRLGINLSSTKLILTQGTAGKIIQTFGHYATSGNIVVGGIVFIVLILIQYIVVNKGAERVAEVAARFTLDALPGKQMSVDADLRSGVLTVDQARQKRGLLIQESKFYGSMDCLLYTSDAADES